jgi:ribulose-phosphate 3-epimerase
MIATTAQKKVVIEPSILSADLLRLGEQVKEVEEAGAEVIQIDVMDGCFVPNITFGVGTVKALSKITNLKLDVHLMICKPEQYIREFVEAGASRIIVHQEATFHVHKVLQTIRDLGAERGVAINPGTPVSSIEEVLDETDIVQVMTVNPGFGGQNFIVSQLDKINRLRRILVSRKLSARIAVDGGIDEKTAPLVVKNGATILVAGSSIYNGNASVKKNFRTLRDSATKDIGLTVKPTTSSSSNAEAVS